MPARVRPVAALRKLVKRAASTQSHPLHAFVGRDLGRDQPIFRRYSSSSAPYWPSPIKQRVGRSFAVAYPSASTRREPRGNSAEQRRCSGRERQNDSTPAGTDDVLLGAGGNLVDTPFHIWLSKPCRRVAYRDDLRW
jgi:hypothetical protein